MLLVVDIGNSNIVTSLKRYDFVYPAAGNDRSVVKLKLDELEKYIKTAGWVDVARLKGGA